MTTTKISWTDHTLNFWWGCTKVSPACQHCYAATMGPRFGPKLFGQPVLWGPGQPRFERLQSALKEALTLNANAERCRIIRGIPMIRSGSVQTVGQPVHGVFVGDVRIPLKKRETTVIPVSEWNSAPLYRPRVFVNSMSDWLDDEVPIEWLAFLLETIYLCPSLDFQLLTKRPENWGNRILWVEKMALQSCLGAPRTIEDFDWENAADFYEWITDWTTSNAVPSNVWIGTTVEFQEWADKRIPHLLKIPAKVRFLSCEPLLGPLDLSSYIKSQITDERKTPRTGNLHCCHGGIAGNHARRNHLESSRDAEQSLEQRTIASPGHKAQSGARSRAIPSDPLDDEKSQDLLPGSSVGLVAFSRENTSGSSDQPQEWEETRQSSCQSRIGDSLREFETCPQIRTDQSTGAEESKCETNEQPSRNDSTDVCSRRGHSEAISRAICCDIPDNIKNCHGQQAYEAGRENCRLSREESSSGVSRQIGEISWLIVGGESGGSARPSHPDWFRSLRDQCAAAGVPFFVKQWGEWISQEDIPLVVPTAKTYQGHKHEDGTLMLRLGTSLAGHLLDGIEHHAFPTSVPF